MFRAFTLTVNNPQSPETMAPREFKRDSESMKRVERPRHMRLTSDSRKEIVLTPRRNRSSKLANASDTAPFSSLSARDRILQR